MTPLLLSDSLFDFTVFTPNYFNTTLSAQLDIAVKTQARIRHTPSPATWHNTVTALETATEALSTTWGIANHLQSVVDTPELRACINDWLPKISDFFTQLGQDLMLMTRYESLKNTPQTPPLNNEQHKVIDNALRDFVLSGANLSDSKRQQFADNEAQLAQLQQTFSEHLLDATHAFEYYTLDASELDGLPADELAARAQSAKAKGKEGYLVTLHMPSYLPVMQYVKNRAVREKLYRAYVTRASDLGATEHDNTQLMKRIVHLRSEQAQLLGYDSYADVSLAAKMADTPAQVEAFLLDLAGKSKLGAVNDWAALKKHAAEYLDLLDVQAWDLAYVSEHLRQAQYAYSDHEVKQYFQESKVFSGLFNMIETLFQVRFIPHDASVWHDSVRVFAVQTAGKTTGYLYVDPYAREGKQGGAWMNSFVSRAVLADGTVQLPIAVVVCNAAQALGDKPALLNHDEVITVFHEFGHALHHLLTQVDSLAVSGISGVEWDAVELPSQFMENYCWEWTVLEQLTAHSDTQAALPKALFDKMLSAKNFQSGLSLLRQVELSLFDIRLHQHNTRLNNKQPQPHNKNPIAAVLDQVRAQVSINPPPAFNRFAHSFGHIFSGGYAAGYYSYKWAEVLSADAFAAFEESGDTLNSAIGVQFRDAILAVGGSRSALENFVAFRGREPKADALLRHNGLMM
jgi:oligopeptidase A